MRIKNWHGGEIFRAIEEKAYDNANGVMDKVVQESKRLCPKSNIYRPPGWSKAFVSFTPKTGRNKGELVQFDTEKRWIGREPGNLRNTIRRVNTKDDSTGTIRVYAGNFKIYWAFMVERGTASTGFGGPAVAQPFLRPAFNSIKSSVVKQIKNGGSL